MKMSSTDKLKSISYIIFINSYRMTLFFQDLSEMYTVATFELHNDYALYFGPRGIVLTAPGIPRQRLRRRGPRVCRANASKIPVAVNTIS